MRSCIRGLSRCSMLPSLPSEAPSCAARFNPGRAAGAARAACPGLLRSRGAAEIAPGACPGRCALCGASLSAFLDALRVATGSGAVPRHRVRATCGGLARAAEAMRSGPSRCVLCSNAWVSAADADARVPGRPQSARPVPRCGELSQAKDEASRSVPSCHAQGSIFPLLISMCSKRGYPCASPEEIQQGTSWRLTQPMSSAVQ
jgi:hypothetical protein